MIFFLSFSGIKIVQQIAILMGCAILPHLRSLVEIIEHGLDDDQQKVRILFFFVCVHGWYRVSHGSALEGSDPHELAGGFEVCQMKGTHKGASELTLFKSYEIGLLRIRPLCF